MSDDFWKVMFNGGATQPPGAPRALSIRDIEEITAFLYDRAALDWPINSAPESLAGAAERATLKANDAIAALRELCSIARTSIEVRDGPFPPSPEEVAAAAAAKAADAKAAADKDAADLAQRSAHRPEYR